MQALFAKKPTSGLLKTLDARTKLLITVVCALLTVALSASLAQIVLFVMTLGYACLLKRPGLLAVLYLLTGVLMALATGFGLLIATWVPSMNTITVGALLVPFLRGLTMMNVVIVLASTTRVEDLMVTLESMRLPFWLFLPTAVMLRFIPTFTQDIKAVWETLRIKGWPIGFAMLTRHPILTARLLFAPILFRALKSSEMLGIAAELKGLGRGERALRVDGASLGRTDVIFFALLCLTGALAIAAQWAYPDLWASTRGMP